jgi:hypothetical protein
MDVEASPLFDAGLAAFMQGGISLNVGACGIDLAPSVARAVGCRISPGRTSVRLLLAASQAAAVLGHVRETGKFAVVFSEPATHRTVQLKGGDAVVDAACADDIAAAARYRDAFACHLDPLGHPPAMVRALLHCPDSDLCAVHFTPSAAFSQTPGAGAGQALGTAP